MGLELNHPKHVEMFESFTEMARGFAQLLTLADPDALAAIDQRMAQGMVVRMTLSIGAAGALGVLFQGAMPDGSVLDLVTIDAPPSKVPFRFGVLLPWAI